MRISRGLGGILAALFIVIAGGERAHAISEGQLKSALERQMESVGGASGAYVSRIGRSSNRKLYSDSGKSSRSLASNTKLFTTAAYLERVGGEGRLETRLFARGRRTGGRERTLKGALILVGDGDPALATPGFADQRNLPLTSLGPLARSVKDARIRTVKGDIIADPTIFDGQKTVPVPGVNPDAGDLPSLSGLSFNRGTEDGRYAQSPAKNAGDELEDELRDIGVRVTGKVRVRGASANTLGSAPLALMRSPTAKTLAKQTNTPSDNFYAEMLLKRLGTSRGKQGTTKRGAKRAEKFAKKAGSGVNMVNGSGLARTNTSSPRKVVKLLAHMRGDDSEKSAFFDSLAIAGKTGTLSGRMRNTAAEGSCRAKTGTISEVSALSGYCRTGGGLVAFSILMNGVNVDSARRAQDEMATAIARFG